MNAEELNRIVEPGLEIVGYFGTKTFAILHCAEHLR